MADLNDLNTVSGDDLTEAQIQGILAQIDLDIHNLTRDGKLSAINYGASRANRTGRWTNRANALKALIEARRFYQKLLESRPAISISVDDGCPTGPEQ